MSARSRQESTRTVAVRPLDATYAYLERHANRILAAGALVTINVALLEVLRQFHGQDDRIYSLLVLGLATTMFLLLHRLVVRMVRFALRAARRQSQVSLLLLQAVERFTGEGDGVRGTTEALGLAAAEAGCEVWAWHPEERTLRGPGGVRVVLTASEARQFTDAMAPRETISITRECTGLPMPSQVFAVGMSAALVVAPMWAADELVGIVLSRFATTRDLGRSQEPALVGGLAALGAVALGKAAAIDREHQRLQDNELLLRSVRLAGESASRDHLAGYALQAAEALGMGRSAILAASGGQLRLVASHGIHRSVTLVARRIPLRSSFVSDVRRAGSTAAVLDAEQLGDDAAAAFAQLGFGGRVVVQPLTDVTGMVGIIVSDSPVGSELGSREQSLLGALSGQATIAIERTKMLRSASRRSRHLACTPKLARSLTGQREPAAVARIAARELHEGFGFGRVSIALRDEVGNLVIAASSGMLAQSSLPVTCTNTMREAFDGRRPYVGCAGDARGMRIEDPNAPAGCRSQLVIPIVGSEGDSIGVIAVYERDPESLGEDDLHILETIADQLTGTIEQAELFETLERSYFKTVEALSAALEAKDAYTLDHARSITELSAEVGRRLGMVGDEIRDLKLGALLHDIGKIGVPEEILQKEGPLTDEEFEVMKEHTVIGEQIIAPIEFLEGVRPLVLHEHERWDGCGYPHGLAGEAIPLGARIIFVCDAWHAMTSTRPYREALPQAEAMRRLHEAAGSQFDPQVVEAFVEVVESGAAALI